MARQPRIEYEGAIYHVMNRGDRREPIVLSDEDRQLFVKTLAEACVKCSWEVHAWCLLDNHFHLVVETPLGNLVAGMKWFLGTYTIRFNARHRLRGHLFSGRYKSLIIDDRDASYLRTVADYVHLNPARAGLVGPECPLETYRWGSYAEYLSPPTQRPGWLRVDRVLGEHGIQRDDRRGRLAFSKRMEALRCASEEGKEYQKIRRGWRFGSEEFVARLLDRLDMTGIGNRFSPELAESMEQRANRIVAEELNLAGWTERDLPMTRKGDPVKVAIAKRLRKETTMTLRWIAGRLLMGRWTSVSNCLRRSREVRSDEASRRMGCCA